MTQTAGPQPTRGLRSSPSDRSGTGGSTGRDLCPLLLADDGTWRSATAAREHRCAALGADVPLALSKQRRLCLTESHRTCATYATAMRLDRGSPSSGTPGEPSARPYPRMAPILLDHGRRTPTVRLVGGTRSSGQMVLAGLMAIAFGAIVVTRFSGAGDPSPAAGGSSPSTAAAPSASPALVRASPTPSVALTPRPSPVPSDPPLTAPPTPARTYTVRRGDTLSGIAAEYGTTVKALVELNDIEDPSRLRVGAVLELP